MDFIDLNKAYPKDHFPMLWIGQLVDSTAYNELYSFYVSFSLSSCIKHYIAI